MRLNKRQFGFELALTKGESDYDNKLRLIAAIRHVPSTKAEVTYWSKAHSKSDLGLGAEYLWPTLSDSQEALRFISEVTNRADADLEIKPEAVKRIKSIAGQEWMQIESRALNSPI